MKILNPLICVIAITCLCSCSTIEHSQNPVTDISNISILWEGGSSRALLTLEDNSVWCLAHNKNHDDKIRHSPNYNSITITQIEPTRGESTQLDKGSQTELKWLNLLDEYRNEHPMADERTLMWINSILTEKKIESNQRMDLTRYDAFSVVPFV